MDNAAIIQLYEGYSRNNRLDVLSAKTNVKPTQLNIERPSEKTYPACYPFECQQLCS